MGERERTPATPTLVTSDMTSPSEPIGAPVGAAATGPRNRVQWGPIIAGTVTALVTLLILAVLGLAIGTSAFEPGVDRSNWGTAAGIWGGASALVALFLGGWIAARSAAFAGGFAGLVNGFLVGAATLLIVLWLTTTGVTNLLGFVGNNVADIASLAADTVDTSSVSADNAQSQAQDAAASAQQAADEALNDKETFDRISNGAWGTLVVLMLALAAATLGGMLGHNERADLRPTAA